MDFVLAIRTKPASQQLGAVVVVVLGKRWAGESDGAGQHEESAAITDHHMAVPDVVRVSTQVAGNQPAMELLWHEVENMTPGGQQRIGGSTDRDAETAVKSLFIGIGMHACGAMPRRFFQAQCLASTTRSIVITTGQGGPLLLL
jgi:hypothetical protein